MFDVTYQAWIKDLFKVQNQTMDFNVTMYRSSVIWFHTAYHNLSNSGTVPSNIHNKLKSQ